MTEKYLSSYHKVILSSKNGRLFQSLKYGDEQPFLCFPSYHSQETMTKQEREWSNEACEQFGIMRQFGCGFCLLEHLTNLLKLWFIIVLSLLFWILISVLVLKSDNILTTHTLSNSQSNFIQSIKPTPVTLLLLQNNCRPNIYELLIFSLLCSHLKTLWIKPLWTQRLWPLWHCTCFTIYSTSLHAYL